MAYLDNTGLNTLWGRIKTVFGAGFADLVKDSSSVTIKLQNGYGNDLDTIAIPLADSTNSKAGLMSPTEKSKLAGIASGAEVNVQADWNVTDSSSDAFIKNKPTIPTGVSPSSTTPNMDGTAAVGSETAFARGDHVHPSDTSRVPTTRKVNGKALSSDINLIAEDIGYDNGSTTVKSWIDKQAEIQACDLVNGTIQIGGYVGGNSNDQISANIYTTGKINELLAGASTALDSKLEGVQINGTDLTVTNKKVNVPVFTGATASANGTVGLVPAPSSPASGTSEPKTKGWFLSANGDFRYLQFTGQTDATTSKIFVYSNDSNASEEVGRIPLPIASTTKAGLVTSTDKTKIDYVDTGKNVTTYVSEQISTAMTGSAKYKGTVGTGGTVTALPTSGYKQGDYYVVVTAGTYAGESCEVGDMIFANKDYASGATAADDWDIVQSNITAMTTAEINAICV